MGSPVRLWTRHGVATSDVREATVTPIQRGNPIIPDHLPSRLGIDASATKSDLISDTASAAREQLMEDLQDSYLACIPASSAIGTVSRTITAGGPMLHYRQSTADAKDTRVLGIPSEARPLQRLLDYINPKQDARQFFRGVCNDVQTFGDSFTEVVWWLGIPVALYDLDAATMRVRTDRHGNVLKYVQKVGNYVTQFAPEQVIQVSYDSPKGSVYGIGPLQMNLAAVNLWIFTTALLKERMRKGNPPNIHFDTAVEVPETAVRTFVQKYLVQNIGIQNIGNPIVTRGMALTELKTASIAELLEVQRVTRDVLLSGLGVPPSQAGVIETGNIGGGTGTSQFKMFRTNTCAPIGNSTMEKFNFHLTWEAFRLPELVMMFREIDWRDDKTIDEISSLRVRDGRWTVNRARDEIGEPPIPGGDEAFIVNRQDMVLISDIEAYSKASLSAKQGAASGNPLAVAGLDDDGKTPITGQAAASAKASGGAPAAESMSILEGQWSDWRERRRRALTELQDA